MGLSWDFLALVLLLQYWSVSSICLKPPLKAKLSTFKPWDETQRKGKRLRLIREKEVKRTWESEIGDKVKEKEVKKDEFDRKKFPMTSKRKSFFLQKWEKFCQVATKVSADLRKTQANFLIQKLRPVLNSFSWIKDQTL